MSTDALAEATPATAESEAWTPADAERLYHVSSWGERYFHVNERGHAAVRPCYGSDLSVDIHAVAEELGRQGVEFPALIRFQDLLATRVVELNEAFRSAIAEAEYEGRYTGVYPIKVNQLREVVEDIVEAGKPYDFGLECGSKAELVATLSHLEDDETLLICNGYKDAEMIRLMLTFQRLGKNVIPVVEKLAEFEAIERLADEMGIEPRFGLRVRLAASGSGKWAESGGDHSKFGVSTPDLLDIVDRLEATGRTEALHLLHFHLGSQIADINNLKAAVREISRVYAYLRHRGLPVRYIDCGGGLGVNYEAGALGAHGAVDYSVQEYANAIVFAVKEICDAEEVPHPTLVSENGRALTAHHSVLIVEVFGATTKPEADPDWTPAKDDHAILHELYRIRELVRANGRSLRLAEVLEAYHDAAEQRQQADTLFSFGYLDLAEKARAERLYWSVCRAINERVHRANPEWLPPDLDALDDHLVDQYLCAFSVFQSILDHWAIGQRFPIMPIHRLDEEPTRRATLVDLTCDSDGKVSHFVAPDHDKRFLEVHPLEKDGRYFLGFFLMGAYQDILGDTHNLFGGVTEAHVYADDEEPENFYVETVIPGTTVQEMLGRVQYFPQGLEKRMEQLLRKKAKDGAIRPREATAVLDAYRRVLGTYTYYDTQFE